MAIVAVAATKVPNLQAALIIAVPALLINASIALSTIASDQIRLAQALLIALSLVVSAVHGLSRYARRTRHTAERKEQRYADVFDTLTEGVLVLDRNGRVLQSNSSLRHMFQLDAAEGIEEVLRFGSVEMTDRYGQPITGPLTTWSAHNCDARRCTTA